MNIMLIIIGALFLVNPNITFFDIIPDFIGCILIMKALKAPSFICYDIKDSYTAFRNLLWVNAMRLPFYVIFVTLGGDSYLLLLFNFIFTCIETYLLLRAFAKLFDGFVYLAMRSGEDDVEEEVGKSSPVFAKLSDIRMMSIIFVIIRALSVLLPELPLVPEFFRKGSDNGHVSVDGTKTLTDFRPEFIIVGIVISLVYGIIWFVNFRKYMLGVKNDKEYIEGIDKKYKEFVEKDEFAIIKNDLFLFFTLLITGTALSVGLRFDGVNLIPEFAGAAFFCWAAGMIRKSFPGGSAKAFRASVFYLVTSVISWGYRYCFINSFFKSYLDSQKEGLELPFNYVLEANLEKSFTVIYMFIGSIAISVLEGVALIFFLVALRKTLSGIIGEHTGKVLLRYDDEAPGDDMTGRTTDSLTKLLSAATAVGIISAAISASESFLCVYFPPVWIPEFLFRGAWMAMLIVLVLRTKDAIKRKYFL